MLSEKTGLRTRDLGLSDKINDKSVTQRNRETEVKRKDKKSVGGITHALCESSENWLRPTAAFRLI